MKKILVLIIIFQSILAFAQEAPKMIKFNAKNAANIFYYDLDEVPSKIKVKKDEVKNSTKKALRVYNDKVKNISFLNFQKLQELELFVNTIGKQARSNPDLAMNIRKKIELTILPIRDSIKKNEEKLNQTLESFLSKKQNKKWIKYQKKKKRSLLPKQPEQKGVQRTRAPIGQRNGRY
ncbi:hypothetical protein MC378_01180 [Polaribacter sp. MSW13]|uniref:DUF4168 domain-containing protein n=1 Tax=Polaribacter marinus TaxID=2916838 RepID=A0A9X2ALF0_9FLAO|nr:hypothetical protein [Polaribacter marinus]MCI2227759.1 hypothetical protein [Polaribacter marinus]